jgi:hypothetical protein
MANKLPQGTFPGNSGPNDFQCFGPPAMNDGDFENARICDMGCFTQDGKDSNKYYHAAVVQHKLTKKWYAYFEWGRTGAKSPSFQFVECSSEGDAVVAFADQLHSKNDKRGQWVTIAGIRTLQAKPGKDCYLVRPMATRSTGLPDARSIKINEGAKPKKEAEAAKDQAKEEKSKSKAVVATSKPKTDPQTLALMRDLSVATVAYTKGSMADASLPTQRSIDEARDILAEAQKRLLVVGDKVEDQVADKDLKQLTGLMYMRIPKKKAVGAPPETWILSKENIMLWTQDLDAFESALYSIDIEEDKEFDPFAGMRLTMEWLPPDSKAGKFLHQWWPKATRRAHHYGEMQIKNAWLVSRHDDEGKIPAAQDEVLREKPKIKERPLFQPKERSDVAPEEVKRYEATNTALLFHGTRSVNVSGILREALRMPKQLVGVVITGAMFGPGLYFADDWMKSAGYTSLKNSYWSSGGGSVRGREAFMFAADVVLGNPFVAPGAHGYTSPPAKHHSVFGKGGRSGVQHNEFIVFSPNQNRLRYLIEFMTK